jgi:SHS family lactate transporter-like MFS transporter
MICAGCIASVTRLNFLAFAIMGALYGLGMGGYWGIGASYAMESAPLKPNYAGFSPV